VCGARGASNGQLMPVASSSQVVILRLLAALGRYLTRSRRVKARA
jgi:hypothetical protein